MADKGCNNCLHYKFGEMRMWEDDIPRRCLLGNHEKFNLWWEENGGKRNTDELTDMDCFEETEFGEFLNESSKILDELKKIVDNG